VNGPYDIGAVLMKKMIQYGLVLLASMSFVLLIVKDYFPEAFLVANLSTRFFIIAIMVFAVGLVATRDSEKPLFSSKKKEIGFQLVATVLFLLLLVLLTNLGGYSRAGIGLDNPIILILFVVSVSKISCASTPQYPTWCSGN